MQIFIYDEYSKRPVLTTPHYFLMQSDTQPSSSRTRVVQRLCFSFLSQNLLQYVAVCRSLLMSYGRLSLSLSTHRLADALASAYEVDVNVKTRAVDRHLRVLGVHGGEVLDSMLEGVTLRHVDRLLGLHRVDQHRVVKLHHESEDKRRIVDFYKSGGQV